MIIFGILNATADSFSDGGDFLEPECAIAHGRALAAGGASVVDIGAAASHPDAVAISSEQEIARLEAIIPALNVAGIALSVDSCNIDTQRYSVNRGVGWINDIRGFPDPAIYPLLADSEVNLIIMHSVQEGCRADRRCVDASMIWSSIEAFFDARIPALEKAGISRSRLILDPGMGFFLGADIACSLAVLAEPDRLKRRYGLPVMLSVSRKSFLRRIAGGGIEESAASTLAAELDAARHGADYLRTHDPAALTRGLALQRAVASYRF